MASNYFLTGCASGMGRHMTSAIVRRGGRAYATDLNREALEQARAEEGWPADRVEIAALDVRDAAQWRAVYDEALKHLGSVDVLMNIAGVLLAAKAAEATDEEIGLQIDVNLKGVIFGTRTAAGPMAAQGHGHIVNIASIAGLVPAPGLSVYCASKYGVRAYSIAAAFELKPKGVQVTAICPSSIQTPMLDNQLDNDAAEMFFSGFRILTLDEIESAIFDRALVKRPYEIHIPWAKAKLARFVDRFPWLGPHIAPLYQWSGRRRQAQRRNDAKH